MDHIDRLRYFLEMAEVENADQFVFVDKCSKNRASVRRRYGRAALSERAIVFRDIYNTSRHSYTFIAAADMDGYVLPACARFDRAKPDDDEIWGNCRITGEVFETWVAHQLCPVLGNYDL